MEQIKNRFTGKIMCEGLSLEVVIERHKKWLLGEEGGKRANLSYANLSRAILSEADLSRADLYGANLSYANLSRANLSYANLSRAILSEADLSRADLSKADLSRANLSDANLSRAILSEADLRIFKHDIWAVLMYAPHEVKNLVNAIKQGKIDGSCYGGECCCLCGTLEKGLNFRIVIRDASSPAEQWFSMISPDDTPENNQASKMALEWIEEWQGLMNKTRGNKN